MQLKTENHSTTFRKKSCDFLKHGRKWETISELIIFIYTA